MYKDNGVYSSILLLTFACSCSDISFLQFYCLFQSNILGYLNDYLYISLSVQSFVQSSRGIFLGLNLSLLSAVFLCVALAGVPVSGVTRYTLIHESL